MKFYAVLFFVLCTGLLRSAPNAQAQGRVFLVSDTHAAYESFRTFLPALVNRIQEFKKQDPNGEVLVLFNGDIGGMGLYSEKDFGSLEYEMVAAVAKHFPTALNMGNHEGLDFSYAVAGDAHGIFLKQTQEYVKASGQPVLAAGMTIAPSARGLFAPYQDFTLGEKRIRVVGVALENFFKESTYSAQAPSQAFESIAPKKYLSTLKEQTLLAAKSGVQSLIFMIHEGAEPLSPVIREFNAWKKTLPMALAIPTPFVGGGHMHKTIEETLPGLKLVEAGSDLSFAEMAMDDAWQSVTSVTQWPVAAQKALENTALPGDLAALVQKADHLVAETNRENSTVLAEKPWREVLFHPSQREEFRKTATGLFFSNALQNWAQKERATNPDLKGRSIEGVIGLYNRLSYGWAEKINPLFEGPITMAMLKQAAHFRGRPGLRLLPGSAVVQLIEGMRKFGRASARPFETPVLSSGVDTAAIKPDALYLVATDHFTAINGYQIPEVEAAYARTAWQMQAPPLNIDIFTAYFQEHTSCSDYL